MLDHVEKELEVTLPQMYKTLEVDGMLDWGTADERWARDELPRLRERPPLLLFADDFRIIPVSEISKRTQALAFKPASFKKFVPFGRTGGGELFGFVFNAAGKSESIAKINTRTESARLESKTLEDFVFKKLLSAAVDVPMDDGEQLDQFRNDLKAMLGSHRAYLPPHRAAILDDVYGRKPELEDGYVSFIGLEEYHQHIKAEIWFEGIDSALT